MANASMKWNNHVTNILKNLEEEEPGEEEEKEQDDDNNEESGTRFPNIHSR